MSSSASKNSSHINKRDDRGLTRHKSSWNIALLAASFPPNTSGLWRERGLQLFWSRYPFIYSTKSDLESVGKKRLSETPTKRSDVTKIGNEMHAQTRVCGSAHYLRSVQGGWTVGILFPFATGHCYGQWMLKSPYLSKEGVGIDFSTSLFVPKINDLEIHPRCSMLVDTYNDITCPDLENAFEGYSVD